MKKLQTPITEENFLDAWNYVDGKLIELQKKKLIRKILATVANIVFFICMFVMTYGFLYRFEMPFLLKYLDSLEGLHSMWNLLKPLVDHPTLHIGMQILVYVISAYAITLLVSAIVFAIVWFAYPSKARTSNEKTSKELFSLAQELEIRSSKKVEGILSAFYCFLYIIALFLLLVFYIKGLLEADTTVIEMELEWIMNNATPIMKMPGVLTNLPQTITILVMIFYIFISSILSKILTLLYTTRIHKNISMDVRKYYYESNEEEKAIFEEEERILARAEEIKAKRKQERDELLAKINYKNPIYKYIKIGITVVLMIITIVFAGNYIKNSDLQKILSEMSFITESTEGSEAVEDTESTENTENTED